MKIDKKKVVFTGVLLSVLAFILLYSFLIYTKGDGSVEDLQQTLVPELNEGEMYLSRKQAVDALKEERETHLPSIYDEKYLDSTGHFDPDLLEKLKNSVVDSVYHQGKIDYASGRLREEAPSYKDFEKEVKKTTATTSRPTLQEMALEQQLFFASTIKDPLTSKNGNLLVEVDGEQTIRANDRLQMRVVEQGYVDDLFIPVNTLVYAVVRFKPNRVLLNIDNIKHQPVALKAFDLQDGLEGIYIKNSFKAQARQEVTDDVIGEVSVPGIPQVKGLKRVFQRTNRNVKVTINDNYRIILKSVVEIKN